MGYTYVSNTKCHMMEVNTQGGRPASWAIPKIYKNKPLDSANLHAKSDFIGGFSFPEQNTEDSHTLAESI